MKESYRTLFMVRMVVFLVVGILLSRYGISKIFEINISLLLIAIGTLLFAFILVRYKTVGLSITYSVLSIMGGSILYTLHSTNGLTEGLPAISSFEGSAILVADSYPVHRTNSRIRAKLISIDSVLLDRVINIELSGSSEFLQNVYPKDTIISNISCKMLVRDGDNEYGGFNYSQYLLDQGVLASARIKGTPAIIKLAKYRGVDIIRYGWRTKGLNTLKRSLLLSNSGLAASLVLGYRNDLDSDVRDQFADSGALHVLAVSGLHVGIIIGILAALLYWLPRRWKYVVGAKAIVFIFCLFIYVLITGSSAPVVRATGIFLLFYLSREIQRDTSSLNLLATVAFLMLIWNPLQLFHVSFQLSFVAVSSIIIFYPYISPLVNIENRVGALIWNITSMSLAAQVLVMPMASYYFYQIPIYFWLSSVIAITMAFIIIPLAFLALLITSLGFSAGLLWSITDQLCGFLLWTIKLISELPFATFSEFIVGSRHMILTYAALFIVTVFLYTRYKRWLFILATYIICAQAFLIGYDLKTKNQALISEYQKNSILILGDEAFVIRPTEEEDEIDNSLSRYLRKKHNVSSVDNIKVDQIKTLLNTDE